MSSSDSIMLVVGLGNIGPEYSLTRHNIGFIALDLIASFYNLTFAKKTKLHADIAEGIISNRKTIFVKPTTYMNLSGKSVQALAAYYRIDTQNIIVLHDDIDLNIGTVKYKLGGGSAGHNGLKSIDSAIGNNYHRIRIGVGRAEGHITVSDYVLSTFPQNEYKTILDSITLIKDNFNLLISKNHDLFKTILNSI